VGKEQQEKKFFKIKKKIQDQDQESTTITTRNWYGCNTNTASTENKGIVME